MSNPKAFISYSWDDIAHKEWVLKLATNLRHDGVETILDQWHAVPGDQLPTFMEREIRENDFVLIICTPNYKVKSDGRKGGVGYEGDIMTAEVHTQKNQRKFIPILARNTWEKSAPSWLKGKYYLDLSAPNKQAMNYPDLKATLLGLRAIAPSVIPNPNRQKSISSLNVNSTSNIDNEILPKQSIESVQNDNGVEINRQVLFNLMEDSLSDENDIRKFCFLNFQEVHRNLRSTARFDGIAIDIINYCESRGKTDKLYNLLNRLH